VVHAIKVELQLAIIIVEVVFELQVVVALPKQIGSVGQRAFAGLAWVMQQVVAIRQLEGAEEVIVVVGLQLVEA
jgi:hypothetical protein